MRPTFVVVLFVITTAAACGRGNKPSTAPAPTASTNVSPATVDSLWNRAMALLAARKWDEAGTLFERIQLELPAGDRRIPLARFHVGETHIGLKSYLQAVRDFRRVADEYPGDSLAPEALLRAGNAYARLWRRPELDPTYGETALATYEELARRYPAAPAAVVARADAQRLSNMFATKDYEAAQHYIRYKLYESAIKYLRPLVADYPQATVAPRALADLITVYGKLGYTEDMRDACDLFRRDYGTALAQLPRTCPVTATSAAPPSPPVPPPAGKPGGR